MGTVTLREAVKGTTTIEVVRKSALHASKCDGCGNVFEMRPWCNDTGLGHLNGTFGECAKDNEGRGLGNSFAATVCSFKCAQDVFTGKWRTMKAYKPFADIDAMLVRAEVKVTSLVRGEKELLAEWDAAAEVNPHEAPRVISGYAFALGGRPTSVDIDRVEQTARALSDRADGVLVQTRVRKPANEIEAAREAGRVEAFREAAALVARMLDGDQMWAMR